MRRLVPWGVAGLSLALFAALCLRYDIVQDDAYISLVYSKNLVAGEGLVFNPGERVEGYTNFLWVLLLALPHALGLDAVAATRVLGVLAALALLWLSRQLAGAVSSRPRDPLLWAAPLWLGACGSLAFWSLSGMETTLFALLVAGGTLRYLRRSATRDIAFDAATGLLFGLAALTRPEGWMFGGLTGLHQCAVLLARRRPLSDLWHLWPGAAGFALLVLPHLAFRWSYYGHPLPNTFYAKTGLSLTYLDHGLRYTGKFLLDYGWAGLSLVLLAALLTRRRTRPRVSYLVLLVAANLTYVTFVGGDTMAENRLYLPVIAPFAALLAEGLRVASLRGAGRRHHAGAAVAVALTAAAAAVAGPDDDLRHARQATAVHNAKLHELADWTLEQARTPTLLASTAIGIPRYRTAAPVLDLVGLTDSTVAHHPVALPGIRDDHILRNYNAAYAMDQRPEALLFITGMRPGTPAERALFLSRRFRRDYRVTYLQDHRPLYLRREGPGHDESLYEDGAFVEAYARALAVIDDDPALSLRLLQRAIDLGPDDFAMPHSWMGRLLYADGDLETASHHLRRALEIDDTVVMAWAHLALIDVLTGGPEAVSRARRAVDLAPRSHFSRYVLGRALAADARPAKAAQQFARAVELGGPQVTDALLHLGDALMETGQSDEAHAAWRSLLTQHPDHADARRRLARP